MRRKAGRTGKYFAGVVSTLDINGTLVHERGDEDEHAVYFIYHPGENREELFDDEDGLVVQVHLDGTLDDWTEGDTQEIRVVKDTLGVECRVLGREDWELAGYISL